MKNLIKEINNYIKKCDDAICNNNNNEIDNLVKELNSKYKSEIKTISLWGWDSLYTVEDLIKTRDNLKLYKNKLYNESNKENEKNTIININGNGNTVKCSGRDTIINGQALKENEEDLTALIKKLCRN